MQQIGKYRVIRKLGAGGFGAVFLAEDSNFGEQVAIKVFRIEDEALAKQATTATSNAGNVLRERFLNEAKLLRQLSKNPYIVDVFDFDVLEDGTPYYVMPYLPSSLRQHLGSDHTDISVLAELGSDEKPKPLPLLQSLIYLEQLLNALTDVHKAGLVHRDIKPANLLLDAQKDIKLCDFGIAKAPDSQVSQSGVGMGSRAYMAPEQRQSAKHVDARSDIYSVGVLAYRMITGTLPEGRFKDPIAYQPNLNEATNSLILKALEQRKEDRFTDAREMLAALKQAAAQSSNTETNLTETTSTWVSDNSELEFKNEFKPLLAHIEKTLNEHGEIADSKDSVMMALASIAGISADELQLFVSRAKGQLIAENPKLAAWVKWVDGIDKLLATSSAVTPEVKAALLSAGELNTDKTSEELRATLEKKLGTSPQDQSDTNTAAATSSFVKSAMTSKVKKLKREKSEGNDSREGNVGTSGHEHLPAGRHSHWFRWLLAALFFFSFVLPMKSCTKDDKVELYYLPDIFEKGSYHYVVFVSLFLLSVFAIRQTFLLRLTWPSLKHSYYLGATGFALLSFNLVMEQMSLFPGSSENGFYLLMTSITTMLLLYQLSTRLIVNLRRVVLMIVTFSFLCSILLFLFTLFVGTDDTASEKIDGMMNYLYVAFLATTIGLPWHIAYLVGTFLCNRFLRARAKEPEESVATPVQQGGS